MTDQLGIGIIGAGGVSGAHAKAYQYLGQKTRLVAVADTDADTARAFKERYQFDQWTTDYQELISREDVHAVSICTPHHLHCKHSVDALNAGKHVLVEKPMAISLEEADAMIAASERNNKKLAVVYQLRMEHDARRAKALIDSGSLGKMFYCEAACLWWRKPSYYSVSWRGSWNTEGGGAVINQASHHLDLMQWLLGMPKSVEACAAVVAHDIEVEDWCRATLQWENFRGSFIATTAAELESDQNRLMALGNHASLQLFPFRPHSRSDEQLGQIIDVLKKVEDAGLSGHVAQIADFVNAISRDLKPAVDGYEGRKSLELATAIYESAFAGSIVELPVASTSSCYTSLGKREAALAAFGRR
ncbi:MAG: Gfo/Idh/MocA family oxidoreductase [Armatimonadetes bacterium]|nr:Gfo/Idh/MocA family oxidoreductase [Armatimonadota bacterium]